MNTRLHRASIIYLHEEVQLLCSYGELLQREVSLVTTGKNYLNLAISFDFRRRALTFLIVNVFFCILAYLSTKNVHFP